jgi:hypothetical protein
MQFCSLHGEIGFCKGCFDLEVEKAMREMKTVENIEEFILLTTPKGWKNEKEQPGNN